MAIGTPTAPVAMASAASGTATTGSFTPAANVALFAFVTARKLSATIATPTVSDSVGLTWTALGNVNYDPGSNPRMAGQLYVAFPGASPSAMTITCTSASASQTAVNVVSVTGASVTAGDYTNVNVSAVNASGDPAATLGSSPAASSGVLGLTFMNATNIITPPTGFTQIEENTAATAFRVETSYDITSPTAGAHTWASTNTVSFGFLVEVKEPSAGGTTITIGAASVNLTEQAVPVIRATTVAVGAASLDYAEQPVSTGAGTVLTVASAAVTMTGQAVATVRARVVGVGSGTVTLTAQALAVIRARLLGIASATISFVPRPFTVDAVVAAVGKVTHRLRLRLGLGL